MPGPARHDGIRCPGSGESGAAPMTADLDIYRTASVLIREHGNEADPIDAGGVPVASLQVRGLMVRHS